MGKNYCFEIYYKPWVTSDSEFIAARFTATMESFVEVFKSLGCRIQKQPEEGEYRELFSCKINGKAYGLVKFNKKLNIGFPYIGFDWVNYGKMENEIAAKIKKALVEYEEEVDIDEIEIPEKVVLKIQNENEDKLCYLDCIVYIGEGENVDFFPYVLDESIAKQTIESAFIGFRRSNVGSRAVLRPTFEYEEN